MYNNRLVVGKKISNVLAIHIKLKIPINNCKKDKTYNSRDSKICASKIICERKKNASRRSMIIKSTFSCFKKPTKLPMFLDIF